MPTWWWPRRRPISRCARRCRHRATNGAGSGWTGPAPWATRCPCCSSNSSIPRKAKFSKATDMQADETQEILCTLRLAHSDLVMQNHRVHDVSVMPGVVFLDLAMRVLAARHQATAALALERILFSEPVVTDAGRDRELRVRIRLPGAASGRVVVDSREWGSGAPFRENMRAALVSDAQPALPDLDLLACRAGMVAGSDMEELYRRARLEKICHNAPMRCHGQLWKGGGALLAELALEVPGTPGFQMHPAALDATTIACYGQTELAFSDPFIPVAIERFRMVRPLPERFVLHAPRTEVLADTGDVITNAYDLYDTAGRHCASFHQLTCKRIRSPELITRLLQAPVNAPAPVAPLPAMPLPASGATYAGLLTGWIAELLAMPPAAVRADVGFYELGLDSRNLLELAARLETVLRRDIYPTLLFEHRDIATLDAWLCQAHGPLPAVSSNLPADVPGAVPDAEPVASAATVWAAPGWQVDQRALVPGAAPRKLVAAGLTPAELAALAAHTGAESCVALEAPAGLADLAADAVIVMLPAQANPAAMLAVAAAWSGACARQQYALDLLFVERAPEPSVTLQGLAAFARCVRLETPRLAARTLWTGRHDWCAAVVQELGRTGAGLPPTAGVISAAGRLQVLMADAASASVPSAAVPSALPPGAVCLIAGGTGGIGTLLAEWLVDTVQARVVVLGRGTPTAALRQRWQSRSGPGSIEFAACDVADPAAVQGVVAALRQRLGGIQAVFHAAGTLDDALHFNIDATRLEGVLASKVAGFHALDDATAQDRLLAFVAFSSLASWRPNSGQGAYAFANAALASLVEMRAHRADRQGSSIAIDWPLWAEGGMRLGEAELRAATGRTGLLPLPAKVAFDCLGAALGRGGATRAAVLYGDAARIGGWLAPATAATPAAPESAPARTGGDIAIVGLAGRYPGADDIDTFWQRLADGHDAVGEIPPERWNHEAIFDARRGVTGKTYGRWGGFLTAIDAFDAGLFNISRREAERTDPQERLFLETCWTLMEEAGYPATRLDERNVGVYVGVMWNHYQLCGEGAEVAPAAMHAAIANRVSYALDLHGPSMAVDTACSSSLTAISLAVDALRAGSCRMAIAGGVNLAVHAEKYRQLAQGQFLSDDGRCRSFGADGTGYVPGEGVGALLLRPLDDALAAGDHVWGVIKGSALNHTGRTSGFTVPSPAAQADVIRQALRNAAVAPHSISYVEAHGTGTALGDPIEIEGLARALGTDGPRPVALGSVKSNIGHLESAAGVAAVSKVLLMLRARQLAPSLHARRINPALDLDKLGLYVQQDLAPWPAGSPGAPRRAAISAFG
ncbi:SDR family NAD(P)-dependent oxidoreductase, partial [Massilia buxea]|nr:SDR family NAD(P)-dependent oxidoreductase [Pseudoduganella buxea]